MSANLMSLARSGGKFLKLYGDRKMMKTMPTAKDYVQDGLVAMWDGIENVGFGKHDANATVWKDLTGNGNDLMFQSLWDEKSAVIKTSGTMASNTIPFTSNVKTLEILYSKTSVGRNTVPLIVSDKCWILNGYNSVEFGPNCVFSNQRLGRDQMFGMTLFSATDTGVLYMNGIEPFIKIGQSQNSITTTGVELFNTSGGRWHTGKIACIRAYSRVMAAEEIVHNYEIDKARFNLPD